MLVNWFYHQLELMLQLLKILEKYTSKDIHGMVHCSGGAQTKIDFILLIMLHVIKDNLFPVPPLFQLIKNNLKQIGKKCIKCLIVDTEWNYMFLLILQMILLQFLNLSISTQNCRVEAVIRLS